MQESVSPSSQGRARQRLSLVKTSPPGVEETQAERLHARLAPVVNRLVWSFLGVDAERDDLVHDIFERILRGVHSVRDQDRLEDWAARVTVNTIKNEFRRRKVRRLFSLEVALETPTMTYHPDFEGRELLLRTTHLLAKLPVNERMPFTLQLLEDRPVDEIARVCGASERTIKRRLKSARERFERLAQGDPILRDRVSSDAQGGRHD